MQWSFTTWSCAWHALVFSILFLHGSHIHVSSDPDTLPIAKLKLTPCWRWAGTDNETDETGADELVVTWPVDHFELNNINLKRHAGPCPLDVSSIASRTSTMCINKNMKNIKTRQCLLYTSANNENGNSFTYVHWFNPSVLPDHIFTLKRYNFPRLDMKGFLVNYHQCREW